MHDRRKTRKVVSDSSSTVSATAATENNNWGRHAAATDAFGHCKGNRFWINIYERPGHPA